MRLTTWMRCLCLRIWLLRLWFDFYDKLKKFDDDDNFSYEFEWNVLSDTKIKIKLNWLNKILKILNEWRRKKEKIAWKELIDQLLNYDLLSFSALRTTFKIN